MTESVDVGKIRSTEVEEEGNKISVDAIIWIDASADVDEENRKAHQELQNLFGGIQIIVFQQSSDCEEYVRQHIEHSFLIIVSRQLAQESIEKIHDLENIKSIYVYCRRQYPEEIWMKSFSKVNYANLYSILIC